MCTFASGFAKVTDISWLVIHSKVFVYGAVAAASYGLNPLFTLPLYADGVSADSVLFYRYGLGVVMLALLMKVQKQSFALHRSEVLPLLVMGDAVCIFLAYSFSEL